MAEPQKASRAQSFVTQTLGKIAQDKGLAATLRRADNPATEYQCWGYLAPFLDLENSRERKIFTTVVAAMARSKQEQDGSLGLGQAIARSYQEKETAGADNEQAQARLRRMLACSTAEEACDQLRPVLQFIASRGQAVQFSRLLEDLLFFNDKKRAAWAKDFFARAQANLAGQGEA